MESEVFHSVQIIEQNHTSISTFTVAVLFQIKHSPHQGFLQTIQCTGKHSTWHLLTTELLIVDWIYAEENHKNEVLLYSLLGLSN